MDSGLPSLGAGKRRREGYPVDEDVKENLKASRQWYGSQRGDDGLNEGYRNNVHYSGLSMENLMRLQQQQQMTEAAAAVGPVVPHLNMQQRVEAAAALQDLRGITTFQPHMKYGVQQVMKTDMSSIGDLSSSCQPPQSPLPLPPQPFIRTPPLHSEADIHNGSPTSSSSGPYPNMAGAPRTSQQCSAPIQLAEPESDSSYSSLLHSSQSGLLAQPKAKSALQQSSQSAQQIRGHSPQSGITQQADRTSGEVDMSRQQAAQATQNSSIQGSHGMSNGMQNGHPNGHSSASLLQNGLAFQHALPPIALQNGGVQQQQVFMSGGGNQLPQGDSSRTSLHQQGRHAMPSSSSHHQQGMHMSQNGVPNGMMHPQIGHRMQDSMVQHQTSQNLGQCISSNGTVAHQSVESSPGNMQQLQPQQMGFPQGVQQIPNSWYPSMRDATTVAETQPSMSSSRLQRHVDAGTFVPMNNGTMFSPAVTDQRGIPTALPQLSQAQSGYRDVLPEQDRHPHGEVQSPLHTMGKVLPVQTDLQGRRFLQANSFSVPSSSGADVNFINPGVLNGALDDPALLPRTFMIPAPKFTRSFTKVYKLGSITRAVDVNRFSNYTELRCELARMFNLDGQLDQKLGWQLVFTDNEDDLLLVGDDPWEEFVRNVRGIRILTPAEVYYYTNEDKCAPPATYNSTGGSAPKPM